MWTVSLKTEVIGYISLRASLFIRDLRVLQSNIFEVIPTLANSFLIFSLDEFSIATHILCFLYILQFQKESKIIDRFVCFKSATTSMY